MSLFECFLYYIALTKLFKVKQQKPIDILFILWYTAFCLKRKRGKTMKTGIHPDYKEAVIKCACGQEYATHSAKETLKVDICSKCHPFFTGKQKFVDSGGRVDKFKKKFNLE